jgi:mannosyltransferase OCH1-like enzyme
MNKLLHIFFGLSNNTNKINIGIVNNYKKFLTYNTDFQLMKWNNSKSLEIIKKHFPEYLNIYIKTYDYRYKCDLVRLIVLYVYGGIYMDIDAECLCNVRDMNLNEEIKLSVVFNNDKTEIFNSLIYVKEKHNEFIKQCIHEYAELLDRENIGACPIMKTVFDKNYKENSYKNENIVIHYEKNTKEKEECDSKEEFWNSFYIFNENNKKIFKSRYDSYYNDRKHLQNTDFMDPV